MKRKIVRHGPSSLTVSLPIKWAKRNGLNAGDEVDVLEEQEALVITGKGEPTKKEITLELKEPYMKRLFVLPYIHGYDQIRYTFKHPSAIRFIEEHADILYGFEIISQTKDSFVVRNIAKIDQDEFKNIVNRMFHVCFDMFELMIQLLEKPDDLAIQRLYSLERSMTRIDLYCRRLINLESFYESSKGSRYATIRIMEGIGDQFFDMTKSKELFKQENKQAVELLKQLFEAFKILEKAYFSQKLEHLFKYKEMELQLWKSINVAIRKGLNSEVFLNLKVIYTYLHNLSEDAYYVI